MAEISVPDFSVPPSPHGSVDLEETSVMLKKNPGIESIAILATVLSIGSYIPVAVDVFSHPTRKIETTSFIVYGLGIGSLFLWLGYGIAVKSNSLIIAVTVTLALALTIFIALLIFSFSGERNTTNGSYEGEEQSSDGAPTGNFDNFVVPPTEVEPLPIIGM